MSTSIAVALSLFLCASEAFAQSEPLTQRYGIGGMVVVPHAQNYNQIEVRLFTETDIPAGRSITYPQEHFAFHNLMPGTYFIVMNVAGFKPVRQRVEVTSLEAGASLPIVLELAETAAVAKPFNFVGQNGSIDVKQMAPPEKALKYLNEAQKKFRKGDIADARSRLESLVVATPDFYDAHLLLGAAYQHDGRFQDAENEFRLAGAIQPRAVGSLVSLAGLYLEKIEKGAVAPEATGRLLGETREVLLRAVQMDPYASFAHYLLGVTYSRCAMNRESEQSFRNSLDLEPRFGDARLGLANLYIRTQDWSSALAALDVYLKKHPYAADREQVLNKRRQIERVTKGAGLATVQR